MSRQEDSPSQIGLNRVAREAGQLLTELDGLRDELVVKTI